MSETIIGEVASQSSFTCRLSLPMRGLMWIGEPTLCTSIWLVAAWRWDMAYLPGDVLSCHCSRRWRLSRDVKLPRRRYLMET
jgi:hypothetical protein